MEAEEVVSIGDSVFLLEISELAHKYLTPETWSQLDGAVRLYTISLERVQGNRPITPYELGIAADRRRPFSRAGGGRRGRWRACARSGGEIADQVRDEGDGKKQGVDASASAFFVTIGPREYRKRLSFDNLKISAKNLIFICYQENI